MDNIETTKLLAEVDQRSKSNTHRIDELERKQEDISELVSSMKVMQNEQEHIKSDVGEIKNNVEKLTQKPAQKWDSMSDKITWLIVGGVAGAVLSLILKATGLS